MLLVLLCAADEFTRCGPGFRLVALRQLRGFKQSDYVAIAVPVKFECDPAGLLDFLPGVLLIEAQDPPNPPVIQTALSRHDERTDKLLHMRTHGTSLLVIKRIILQCPLPRFKVLRFGGFHLRRVSRNAVMHFKQLAGPIN